MQARRLKGRITDTGELVVDRAVDLPPGDVELIVLYAEPAAAPVSEDDAHPAFGLWADRSEAEDASALSLTLRRRIESRGDARD